MAGASLHGVGTDPGIDDSDIEENAQILKGAYGLTMRLCPMEKCEHYSKATKYARACYYGKSQCQKGWLTYLLRLPHSRFARKKSRKEMGLAGRDDTSGKTSRVGSLLTGWTQFGSQGELRCTWNTNTRRNEVMRQNQVCSADNLRA